MAGLLLGKPAPSSLNPLQSWSTSPAQPEARAVPSPLPQDVTHSQHQSHITHSTFLWRRPTTRRLTHKKYSVFLLPSQISPIHMHPGEGGCGLTPKQKEISHVSIPWPLGPGSPPGPCPKDFKVQPWSGPGRLPPSSIDPVGIGAGFVIQTGGGRKALTQSKRGSDESPVS